MDIHDMLHRSRSRALHCARALSAAIVLAAMPGCLVYPDSDERIDDDLVITTYAPKAEFDTYKTFAIKSDITLFDTKADGEIEKEMVDEEFASKIIDRLASKMEARGYEKVEMADNPDLGLSITGLSGLVVGSVSYWGGYYGWYWGYPGWGYYYPYDVYYAYEPGTMVIDMVDLAKANGEWPRPPDGRPEGEDPPAPGSLSVVWLMSAYRAYVDDNKSGKLEQINDAIDQAFDQSPYLKAE